MNLFLERRLRARRKVDMKIALSSLDTKIFSKNPGETSVAISISFVSVFFIAVSLLFIKIFIQI